MPLLHSVRKRFSLQRSIHIPRGLSCHYRDVYKLLKLLGYDYYDWFYDYERGKDDLSMGNASQTTADDGDINWSKKKQ